MSPDTDHAVRRGRIEKQRRLPFSKAVEISLKSIKVRFWRSMLTVSSIILAIAFLMSQLTGAEINRTLEEVAQQRVPVSGKGLEWRVDVDALPLKDLAERLKDEADKVAEALQPELDAFDTAEARLLAGKTLADLEVVRGNLERAEADLERARKALEDPAVQKAREEYEADDARRQRLEMQRRNTPPASERFEELDRQLEELERRLRARRRAYKDYLRKRTDYEVALARVEKTRKRLADLRESAAEARQRFPDIRPAPEGSEQYDRLYREFRSAKRRKERAEKRITAAQRRAERALKRFENASHKALEELLVKHGERSADGSGAGREVRLPLNLRLSSTRLWITGLALLVCLVGITNAMLMSVTERYREIGTMKCLGALDSFIVKIFLLESSFVGILGVVIGVVLGFVLAFLVQWKNFGGFATRYFPTGGVLKWAAVAFLVGALMSTLGGILPAKRAAGMAPVDAMRIEE